jgi:hypothetical protein
VSRGPRDNGPVARSARDSGPVSRPPRGGQGRRPPGADGYDRRGGPTDDFAGRPRPSGEFQASGRGRPDVVAVDGFDGLRSGALLRWLGTMSTLTAALVLAGATVIGVVLTLIAGTEPGKLLGFFVIVGSLVAVLGVRRGAVYLLFPMPALAFFVGAVVTGVIHDRELAASTAGLGVGFTQWVAGIFFPAVVATILVLLVGGTRWLLKSPLVTRQHPLPGGRPVPRDARASQGFRSPVDSRADDRFMDDGAPRSRTGPAPRQQTGPTPQQGTGPTPRQGTGPTPQQGSGPWRGAPNGSRPGRPPRDPRTDRDPWGDPRLPPDRSQPTGPRPQAPGRPASQPMPRAPGPAGPSWNPAPGPQRPSRRPPPDGWTQ